VPTDVLQLHRRAVWLRDAHLHHEMSLGVVLFEIVETRAWKLLGFETLAAYCRDRLDMSPCGLNILDVKAGAEARLVLYNDVSHYATVPGPTEKRLSPWWA